MKKGCFGLLIVILIGCATTGKEPDIVKKHALVIGNSNYGGYAKLKNSINDAEDISKVLEQCGYSVELCLDINLAEMETKIDEYAENLSKQEDAEGFFYFAGMGVRINGNNYMVPTAISANNEEQLGSRSYELGRLFGKLIEADNAVNVVIIDACFSNVSSSSRSSSSARPPKTGNGEIISSDEIRDDGLELIEQFSKDIFYFQSALPGRDAFDGDGRNSPFTQALLANALKPGKLTDLVQEIITDTRANSGGSQRPYFKANVFNYRDYAINK